MEQSAESLQMLMFNDNVYISLGTSVLSVYYYHHKIK